MSAADNAHLVELFLIFNHKDAAVGVLEDVFAGFRTIRRIDPWDIKKKF